MAYTLRKLLFSGIALLSIYVSAISSFQEISTPKQSQYNSHKSKIGDITTPTVAEESTILTPETQVQKIKIYSFTVYGEPTPLSRHRLANGIMYNPSAKLQKKFLHDAREFLPLEPLEGPISMEMKFYFSRPLSHFRTGKYKNLLKDTAPIFHYNRKDVDNLAKFVMDALNKVVYKDDSQVSEITCGKYYTSAIARSEITIRQLIVSDLPGYEVFDRKLTTDGMKY